MSLPTSVLGKMPSAPVNFQLYYKTKIASSLQESRNTAYELNAELNFGTALSQDHFKTEKRAKSNNGKILGP
jgi:hypothetical protein